MSTTKELAKELGLIRTRQLRPHFLSDKEKTKKRDENVQVFRYFIVIDFESTCWKERGFASPEIIEFPAILFDAQSGKESETFHHYVQPTEHPKLSLFCRQLTGISQNQVDDGIPIGTAVILFRQWISKITDKYQLRMNDVGDNGCTFVTWSDWDLQVCLGNEIRRKNLNRPHYLNAWIDIRLMYSKFYGRKPQGLNGALKDLAIEFQGREHSGIEDARNTGVLLLKMIGDGCPFKITKSLPGLQIDPSLKADLKNLNFGHDLKTPVSDLAKQIKGFKI